MATRAVTFSTGSAHAFSRDVKKRVDDYFRTSGRSKKANANMVTKTVLLLAATFVPYALIITNSVSLWTMLALCVLMGLGTAGMGAAVCHDALHGAYSSKPRVNKLLGYCFELMGASGYMWKITHNVIHHTYTNVPGVDEDLLVSPLLRLSREAEREPIHRFQHWYAVPLYSLTTLFWVFVKDFKYFLRSDLGPYEKRPHPPREIVFLLVSKAIYYGYMIVLPLAILPITWWQFAIGFLVIHLTAGTILGLVFQLAHVVEGPDQPVPDATGNIDADWLVHEMETTANFAGSNRWLTWYIGGLNYQIEHHLFPRVCSVHYPSISGLVRQTAQEHGVSYHAQPTFLEALRSHVKMLKLLGRPAAAPTPVAAGTNEPGA